MSLPVLLPAQIKSEVIPLDSLSLSSNCLLHTSVGLMFSSTFIRALDVRPYVLRAPQPVAMAFEWARLRVCHRHAGRIAFVNLKVVTVL